METTLCNTQSTGPRNAIKCHDKRIKTIMRQQSKQSKDEIMFLSSWTPPLQMVHYPGFYAFCPVRLREQSPGQSVLPVSGRSKDLVACWYPDLIDQIPILGRSWTVTVEEHRKQSDLVGRKWESRCYYYLRMRCYSVSRFQVAAALQMDLEALVPRR